MKEQAIVIIGAGQAGSACAARLRNLGHSGPLTLIGDEDALPYQRPPLSKKYLLGDMTRERLCLKPESFYAENEIAVVTGERVVAIDRENREVRTTRGNRRYDSLVLATGASPRRLPDRLGGGLGRVYTMRTMADADAIAPEFVPGRRVVIVGGGYIGLEAAAVAAARGLEVHLVEMAPRILQRVAASETADHIRELHGRHGVELIEAAGIERLTGTADGPVTGARLSDGRTLPADFVIVGIGVDPETALAAGAGLTIDNGIAVDACGRTSDPRIFAAGDCASFPFRGARIRLESVQNAIDQAEHVAATILGAEAAYEPIPWFWSDQYDCRLQIAGLNMGYDRTIRREGHRPGGESVWYYRGDRFLAVDAINDPKAYMQGKRWLEAGQSPDPDRLADPQMALRELV